MTQWHGGKGSSSRPLSVTQEEYANRWDLIFGRDKHKIEQEPEEVEDTEDLDKDEEEHDCESEE
jgi:hypothetical protein